MEKAKKDIKADKYHVQRRERPSVLGGQVQLDGFKGRRLILGKYIETW